MRSRARRVMYSRTLLGARVYRHPIDAYNPMPWPIPVFRYEQMMQLIAEDRAIEDLLYGLFVSFRESRMDLASYMSKLRSLTREQFEIRTLLMRARDVAKSVYE